jgi:hypothetical protein
MQKLKSIETKALQIIFKKPTYCRPVFAGKLKIFFFIDSVRRKWPDYHIRTDKFK